MKRLLIILIIFFPARAFSQNLVPNSGFEQTSSCPLNNYGEINRILYWYNFVISADYYNCSIGVPNNMFGHQFPNTGTSYIGFGHSERVAVKLIQTLEAGKRYEFKMHVATGIFNNYASDFAFILSEDSLCEFSKNYDIYYVSNGSPLTDTVNWTLFSTSFVAKGCEEFLGLDIPFTSYTYYFFDDISLKCIDTSGCIPPQCPINYTANIPNVFSPNKDGINEEFRVVVPNTELSNFNCTVYNRWGQEVIKIDYPNTSWNGKNKNGDDLPDGVYYYFLSYTITECGEWFSNEGYVHLMR